MEGRRHSDFLFPVSGLGRAHHSFFLQQIPQQLLQVCVDIGPEAAGQQTEQQEALAAHKAELESPWAQEELLAKAGHFLLHFS